MTWKLTRDQRFCLHPGLSSRPQTVLLTAAPRPRWRPAALQTWPGSERRRSRWRPSVHPDSHRQDVCSLVQFFWMFSVMLLSSMIYNKICKSTCRKTNRTNLTIVVYTVHTRPVASTAAHNSNPVTEKESRHTVWNRPRPCKLHEEATEHVVPAFSAKAGV